MCKKNIRQEEVEIQFEIGDIESDDEEQELFTFEDRTILSKPIKIIEKIKRSICKKSPEAGYYNSDEENMVRG